MAATLLWIAVFGAAAGLLWPQGLALASMALAYLGLVHLAVLTFHAITRAQFREAMSPQEFELYCAQVLREMRWIARVTPFSGDQGADIVAQKRGLRIVVQCKKYTKPVGNRAVQEVVAAIAHQDADRGVVVATADFTPAAMALAESNRVLLLRREDLQKLDRLLRR